MYTIDERGSPDTVPAAVPSETHPTHINMSYPSVDLWMKGQPLSNDYSNSSVPPVIPSKNTNSHRVKTMMGTVSYMAPEALLQFSTCNNLHLDTYTAPMNYWSLGVLIYTLLVGVEPYISQSIVSIRTKLPRYLEIFEFFHEAFRALFGIVDYDVCNGILTEGTRSILQNLFIFQPLSRLGYDKSDIISGHKRIMDHSFFAHNY